MKDSSPGMFLNLPMIPVLKEQLGGRIGLFYQNWADVTNDPLELETVSGYKIVSSFSTPGVPLGNVCSAEDQELLDQEVLAL